MNPSDKTAVAAPFQQRLTARLPRRAIVGFAAACVLAGLAGSYWISADHSGRNEGGGRALPAKATPDPASVERLKTLGYLN
jgi:hypothetical protein